MPSPLLRRRFAIERFAGLPPQFERTTLGWFFRRHGHGPAIRVSDAEQIDFAAAGVRAVLLHAAALPLFGWLAWLVLDRALAGWSGNALALLFGIVLALVVLALHASLRRHADAPARALAGRPPERPARDPDASRQPGYATIVGLTIGLLFLAAIGTRQPTGFYLAFASASVVLGLFLLARRWRFDRALTPPQRAKVRETVRAERAAAKAERSWGAAAMLLVFVVVQMVVLIAAVMGGVAIVQGVTGMGSDELTFGPFMVGFVLGMAVGGLIVWPLELLCRRWTGGSAIHAFDWIPAGW